MPDTLRPPHQADLASSDAASLAKKRLDRQNRLTIQPRVRVGRLCVILFNKLKTPRPLGFSTNLLSTASRSQNGGKTQRPALSYRNVVTRSNRKLPPRAFALPTPAQFLDSLISPRGVRIDQLLTNRKPFIPQDLPHKPKQADARQHDRQQRSARPPNLSSQNLYCDNLPYTTQNQRGRGHLKKLDTHLPTVMVKKQSAFEVKTTSSSNSLVLGANRFLAIWLPGSALEPYFIIFDRFGILLFLHIRLRQRRKAKPSRGARP